MIGEFDIEPPPIDDDLSQMVESHRSKTGQEYAAILFFGLWGTADCSAEVRLYAGYRHLADFSRDGPAWLEVARIHIEEGEIQAAERILDELQRLGCPGLYSQLYGEDPDVHRAYARDRAGEPLKALELLDALRTRHEGSPVYHFFVGNLLHEKGDLEGAAEEYRQALAALEEFRAATEEDDDTEVDFTEAKAFVESFLAAAEDGEIRILDGRPLDLSGFREEE